MRTFNLNKLPKYIQEKLDLTSIEWFDYEEGYPVGEINLAEGLEDPAYNVTYIHFYNRQDLIDQVKAAVEVEHLEESAEIEEAVEPEEPATNKSYKYFSKEVKSTKPLRTSKRNNYKWAVLAVDDDNNYKGYWGFTSNYERALAKVKHANACNEYFKQTGRTYYNVKLVELYYI